MQIEINTFLTAIVAVLLLSTLKLVHTSQQPPPSLTSPVQLAKENAAFFKKISTIQLIPSNFQNQIGLTFRTCSPGTLFSQDSERSTISLNVAEDALILLLRHSNRKYETKLLGQFFDNLWHNVNILIKPNDITLIVDENESELVADGSHNVELLNSEENLLDMSSKVTVGEQFSGCILGGPGLPINSTSNQVINVEWGPCPFTANSCSQCRKANNECPANGRCDEDNMCVCDYGYTGVYPNCTEISTCIDLNVPCMNGATCMTSTSSSYFNCTCPTGFSGKLCQHKIKACYSNPCQNNATCMDTTNGFQCQCSPGFTGSSCENDIDECKLNICKNGHCVNSNGGYQCFCIPGYTGDHCELDVDECLSQPCQNGATCVNGQNRFTCKCPPGFTGKDCSINVDECSPNPCLNNGSCIDGNNSYTCRCSVGFTGTRCEVNIDDCKSSPCLNSGVCIDAIDDYSCNCANTGFMGDNCEINIDDCVGNQCVNNGTCKDLIKDYHCECFPGYTGKDCQEDINECENNPCQYGGTCLQRSNHTLYNLYYNRSDSSLVLPAAFSQEFSFASAHGYDCLCIAGVTGNNCETDIKECESNPCHHGTCREEIGKYSCDCSEGYYGTHCETEIDECAAYKPCVHGTCFDKVANYICECPPSYGGKNCSVELIGCVQGPACLNNGMCKPYLLGEMDHRFNCTCPSGFHGAICEKVTTMSLNGEAYIAVNTTRDEGYDISFRFKTTLPSGLLAMGKGSTLYILELMNGRLNLHSSLLNKFEGVFVGSGLNDSNWQKVFVAINSSHVVLAANEEQTIYPITYNDGVSSSNWTSFPTTLVGGTATNIRTIAHGPPVFIGCIENIVINGQWVTNETNNVPVEMSNVEFGCKREDQCKEDSCNGVGQCTDLWKNFTCSCQRPYFGNRCEYNVTAATFGHENITNSLVTVSISNQARKAIRTIIDISMFIRTRQSKGAIFYLGSLPGSVMLNEETHVAAELVDGELLVRIHFHNTTEAYTVGGVKLNDGRNHLIQVIRNVTLVQVKINGTEYFRKTIGSSASLDAQVLYLGGYPVQTNENESLSAADMLIADPLKSVKDAAGTSKVDSLSSNARYTRQTADKFDNIPHFKGVIQDVQLSNGSLKMTIEIFSRKALGIPKLFGNVSFDSNTVLEGVLSDDACASNPCFNDANCTVSWNDFACECPRGYKGKQCKDMEFCQLKHCPADSQCRNFPHGYECVTNLTMHGSAKNTSFQYSFVQNDKSLTQANNGHLVEIMYRSKTGGTLLYVCNAHDSLPEKHLYFFVFVYNDMVTVAWKLDHYAKETWHRIEKEPTDGEWTSITIKIDGNKIFCSFSNVENESGQSFSSSNFSSAAWYNLITTGKIYIGGGDNIVDEVLLSHKHSYQLDGETSNSVEILSDIIPSNRDLSVLQSLSKLNPNGVSYKGCVGEIRINKILLPFFTEDQLNNNERKGLNYFTLHSQIGEDIDYGCYLCFQADCKNGGRCANETQNYSCNCEAGFDGEDCSHDIDECEQNRCHNHASCVNGIGNYTCQCAIGWTGWLCDIDIDECASQPCHNNGSCADLLGHYKCACTEEFVGKNCEQVRLVTCENNRCKNGAQCSDKPNVNVGDNFTCDCLDGFIGTYCDETFCNSTPCKNHGKCVIKQKVPMCECVQGFQGMYCENNINDCQPARDGSVPCLHNGRCVDGVASYSCNCSETGFKGDRCETDIDECVEGIAMCGLRGTCKNEPGNYRCECEMEFCGKHCDLYNPCKEKPCQNGGSCRETCIDEQDYECACPPNFTGKNCTEVQLYTVEKVVDIALIVGPIAAVLILALIGSLVMFFMMARNKRATRGTYSPSSQEYCNPRVELDNVMKPPPEERLI